QHYSYALETKSEQKIVTSGPYARVRHPLYSTHNVFNLGMIFLTANIPLIFFAFIGIPFTYARMKKEEQMMLDKFGAEYEEYRMKTGRIFPKL
ncbi:MAG: methyltransferase family protein, partial [Candidatus Thorarchaeota archaeon]